MIIREMKFEINKEIEKGSNLSINIERSLTIILSSDDRVVQIIFFSPYSYFNNSKIFNFHYKNNNTLAFIIKGTKLEYLTLDVYTTKNNVYPDNYLNSIETAILEELGQNEGYFKEIINEVLLSYLIELGLMKKKIYLLWIINKI